jgi:hypothetical protein
MDELLNTKNPDGQYGTEALEAVGDAALAIYDLVDAVYLDDGVLNASDLVDAALIGPKVVSAVTTAIESGSMVGKEATDLSEAEKARLQLKYGDRIQNPGFNKIFKGVLQIVDGASELIGEGNPPA